MFRWAFTAVALLGLLADGARSDEPPPAADSSAPLAEDAHAARVAELIAELGDDDFFVRQQAQEELERIGFEAFDALDDARQSDDVEIAARATSLIRRMQSEWTEADDPPEIRELLADYKRLDQNAHLLLLQRLAALPQQTGLPVLCRLIRFDRSEVLSKLAALALIEGTQPPDDAGWRERASLLRRGLGRSDRAAAEWLNVYLAAHDDPGDAAARWGEIAASEQKALTIDPRSTQPAIVMSLWRQQAGVLRKLARREEAVEAMVRVVELEEGGSNTLGELLNWLIDESDFEQFDLVAKKFNGQVRTDPLLLYQVAQARQKQGDTDRADETIAAAVAINQGNQAAHFNTARALQGRGMFDWSQKEYEEAVAAGRAGSAATLECQRALSEMLYDQARYADAASLLETSLAAVDADAKQGRTGELEKTGREPQEVQARIHYFRACGQGAAGEGAAQLAELEQALAADQRDIDVLIALYGMANLPPDLRKRVVGLIDESAQDLRDLIDQAPEEPDLHNQLAWLLSHTHGDKQEALQLSKRSLELSPNSAGYLDTLGRCYYALGDYPAAVRYQRQAVERDPHGGQIRRQLELFERTLAEKNGAK
jgi:tetratricopeptide (TPR) repeat protein